MTRSVCLVKFGGGLVTDKSEPEAPRRDRIDALARSLAEARRTSEVSFVLGHGSGSFGHQAARESILAEPKHGDRRGPLDHRDRLAVARTADAAARLHRIVIESLLASGIPAFSWLVSSVLSDSDARPAPGAAQGIRALLDEGLVPVTMGDVVVGGPDGTEIWPTERVLRFVADDLHCSAWTVQRALWFGNTDGILDPDGQVVDEVDEVNFDQIRQHTTGSAGVDVTGGMRLRFDTCADLARSGVESWVLDGRDPAVVAAALRGERVGGTRFVETSADHRSGE